MVRSCASGTGSRDQSACCGFCGFNGSAPSWRRHRLFLRASGGREREGHGPCHRPRGVPGRVVHPPRQELPGIARPFGPGRQLHQPSGHLGRTHGPQPFHPKRGRGTERIEFAPQGPPGHAPGLLRHAQGKQRLDHLHHPERDRTASRPKSSRPRGKSKSWRTAWPSRRLRSTSASRSAARP